MIVQRRALNPINWQEQISINSRYVLTTNLCPLKSGLLTRGSSFESPRLTGGMLLG